MKKFIRSDLNRHPATLPALLAFVQAAIWRGVGSLACYVSAMKNSKAGFFTKVSCFAIAGVMMACAPKAGPETTGVPDLQVHSQVVGVPEITVTDLEGQAIAGAKIQIGPVLGQPFAANLLTVDASGKVVAPNGWQEATVVTIDAPGFIRASYFAQSPGSHTYKLRRADAPKSLQLQGQTTGFGNLTGNGVLDLSLVFSAVPRSDVASLELTQLIGTGVDKVSVYGETLELPSNLSVPKQTETYFMIVPVTLDKPSYRLSVAKPGSYRFAAVHAQFDFKKTIDDMRDGKSFFDVINRIQFRSYSTRDLTIQQPNQAADFKLGATPLKASVAVRASGLPKGYAMVATSLVESGGYSVVTDVKRLLEGESRTLMTAPPARNAKSDPSRLLVRTLKKYDAKRTNFSGSDYEELSAIVSNAGANPAAGFLPILKPIVSKGRSIVFDPPKLPVGLQAGLTQVTLSKVEIVGSGQLWLVKKSPRWDLYAPEFAKEMTLPSLGAEPWAVKGQYRWELLYAAGASVSESQMGPGATSDFSHVTKTAIDFVMK